MKAVSGHRFKILFLIIILLNFNFNFNQADAAARRGSSRVRDSYDVVIAGAGMGGIAAGIQAARMGASVLIIEPSSWVGGQACAAGVSTMDTFNDFSQSGFHSGLYAEFINKMRGYYDMRSKSMGTCYWYPGSIAFEPHIGREVLLDLVNDARRKGRNAFDIFLLSNIIKVNKNNNKITGVVIKTPGFTRNMPASTAMY